MRRQGFMGDVELGHLESSEQGQAGSSDCLAAATASDDENE
jgi:hypothetical protein